MRLFDNKRPKTVQYKKIIANVQASATKYINIYFEEIKVASKSTSSKAVKNYYKNKKREERKHTSLWNRTKIFFYKTTLNSFNFFFKRNSYPSFISEYDGKRMALASIPKYLGCYPMHKKMFIKYHALIKNKTK